jgi:hypothetical protein
MVAMDAVPSLATNTGGNAGFGPPAGPPYDHGQASITSFTAADTASTFIGSTMVMHPSFILRTMAARRGTPLFNNDYDVAAPAAPVQPPSAAAAAATPMANATPPPGMTPTVPPPLLAAAPSEYVLLHAQRRQPQRPFLRHRRPSPLRPRPTRPTRVLGHVTATYQQAGLRHGSWCPTRLGFLTQP